MAKHVLSSVVSSQVDIHARYGGVVPEVASRAHVDLITPVIAQTLIEAGIEHHDLDLVAATLTWFDRLPSCRCQCCKIVSSCLE